MINNIILAYICNDPENHFDYSIDNDNCYYKNDFIGEIKDGIWNIYFKPVKKVEYIRINFTMNNSNYKGKYK